MDPIIEECVADAIAPYRALLTPAELEEHRRLLTLFITTQPEAAAIHDRLRARTVGKSSGDVVKESWTNEATAEELRERAEGGKR